MKFDENTPIGEGTTTLDYLYYAHPWLKTMIEEKDKEIEDLKTQIKKLEWDVQRFKI